MSERLGTRCAAESLSRDEPLHGTASRVQRWLVLEQPGPWGREALLESRLDHEVAHGLRSVGRRLGLRVLLTRLPGRAHSGERTRRVYLAHSGRHHSWIEQVDVEDPREVLGLDLDALASTEAPGVGAPGPAAVHLVCTNGRHDPCCADFGRPVVRALHAAGTPEVWESSHVGGDRFAANIVCLPLGVYFGRVEPDTAAQLLADYARGLLDLDRYRGRSCFPPLVQSAEVYVRRELDERRIDALSLVSSERRGDELTVRFDHTGGPVQAIVARERGNEVPMTCHGGNGHPWQYVLRSLQRI